MHHQSPFARLALRSAAIVALAALPSVVVAQDALPSARSLVDKYVSLIGGRDKILGLGSTHTVGTFEVPAQGVAGEYDLNTAKPNMMVMKISIPGLGDVASGFDGNVAWSNNPMQGPRVLSGPELEAAKEQADPETVFRPDSKVTSMETVEKTQMGGQSCYKVKVVWKSGRTTFDCYSTDSGLLVGSSAKQETQMGTIDATTTFSDYKEFGGIKRATKVTVEAMGMQQVMTVKSMEFNGVDAKIFELPADIKALVGKKP
jgi:hypothetical protein